MPYSPSWQSGLPTRLSQGKTKSSPGVGLLGKLLISGKMELMLQSVLKDLAEVHIALKGCGVEPRRESDRTEGI